MVVFVAILLGFSLSVTFWLAAELESYFWKALVGAGALVLAIALAPTIGAFLGGIAFATGVLFMAKWCIAEEAKGRASRLYRWL